MLAARAQALKRLKSQNPFVEEGHLLSKLMAYCSKEAHSCVEKAAMICFVKLRILEPDENASLRGDILGKAMEEDELHGLVPFFVSTTLGTTGSCAFDNLYEIGIEIQRFPCVWLHVDAAYAGNSFICPELKPLLKVRTSVSLTLFVTEKPLNYYSFHAEENREAGQVVALK